jgi:polygalacturonase
MILRCILGTVIPMATISAQDTRTVVEPKIPQTCSVVHASLSAIERHTLVEADEAKLDTERIQHAIDSCRPGQAVELKADGTRNAFVSGPLALRPGITLIVAAKTILFASRNPRDYDLTAGSCGIVNESGRGCKPLIGGNHVSSAAVMGDGVIDGRGWAKLTGQDVTWWDLAEKARAGGNQNNPRLIVLSHCDNFTLYKITLKNSPNFHVYYGNGNGFTAWGVIIDTPKSARNSDGIDPGSSTNVTITHCYIHTGDDNVVIKAGGHSSHMTVAHNHFYTGHGISIGSETNGGVDTIRVSDLSIDVADNGIRIKSNSSRGGLVHDVVYDDICIRETKNPIIMESDYMHFGHNGDKPPTFTGIVLRNVRVLSGQKITLDGYDATHRLGMQFDNVYLDPPLAPKVSASYADFTLGPGPVNFKPSGNDVSVTGTPGKGAPNACRDKFVPMPAE